MNGAVFRAPDEETGVIANLGKRSFKLREVCGPIAYDARSMAEGVILECGDAVAVERIGRNS